MTVDDHTLTGRSGGTRGPGAPPPLRLGEAPPARKRRRPKRRGKLRKLRLLVILIGFVVIAGIAFMFGVLTSVASDLHGLSNAVQYQEKSDSVLYDATGKAIGTLAPPNASVIDRYGQISKNMVNAIVSTEDKNFWTEPGIDLRSIARAMVANFTGGSRQGASTITEQFVKNVEAQQNHRTVFEKLREAGLAFQLVHHWKRPKILDQYLNIIYFGEGAYGIEAAARTYFGKQLGYDPNDPSGGKCGTPTVARPHMPSCASKLRPYQAAMLVAMVANPTAFDPLLHKVAAKQRRNTVVLRNMYEQGYISRAQYEHALTMPVPTQNDIQEASEPAAAPYFTAWVRPQIISALEKEGVSAKDAEYEAYYGGLKVKLTINLQMQQAAQNAVEEEFGSNPNGPTASLVSIDNSTGEVRAMVSSNGDYTSDPFNLATLGYRQPGSSFKLFTLVDALESGKYGPDSVFDSKALDIPFTGPNGEPEHFVVHNDEDSYLGPITLQEATDVSDNTVFAQLGMALGTKNIANQAHLLGVRTPISTNPAMIIGGLTHGVSPLDMAHAYETIANGGKKVYNKILGDVDNGAIGIDSIQGCDDCKSKNITNAATKTSQQVVSPVIAADVRNMLEGVVERGTGTKAAIPGVEVVGKTGTTSNYVDAWFCGWTSELTTCVWVGYPNSGKSMSTDYDGGPVTGGTYPAIIWHNYTEQALNILTEEQSAGSSTSTSTIPIVDEGTGAVTTAASSTAATGTEATTPADTTAGAATTGGTAAQGADTTAAGGTAAATGGTADTTPAVATTPATAATTPAAASPSTGSAAGAGSSSSGSSSGSAGSGATGGAGIGG